MNIHEGFKFDSDDVQVGLTLLLGAQFILLVLSHTGSIHFELQLF